MATITFDEVKRRFEARGYILLEKNYINNHTKMKYVCPNHKEIIHEISLCNLTNDRGCPTCGRENTNKKRALTYEYVLQKFTERGYKLVSDSYKNSKTKLKYICRKHNEFVQEILWTNFYSGKGCKYCGFESSAEKQRLNFEYVKKKFQDQGLKLLETTYKNASTKMKYVCLKHAEDVMEKTYSDLQSGYGCPKCGIEKQSAENHYNWKGGISSLNCFMRQKVKTWTEETMQRDDYTCFVTGEKGVHLEVHHIRPFHIIREEVLKELNLPLFTDIVNYSKEQLNKIGKSIEEKHKLEEGITLKKDIHILFHSIFGDKTTKEQLYEFKDMYLKGELKDQL
ncbi:HNH endonuclease [Bacillus sp. FSL R12-0069]|uniref:HNH endonuclease n=1 Tax=Bacillus sp. FSL R12-0069 TaxID=2975342 RepID=UPI0030F5D523